ncbi:MAG: hypothetical protein ACXVCX_11300 [Ktedonobacterales bacterium]
MQRLYVVAFPELAPNDESKIEAIRAAHDSAGYSLLKAHFTFVFSCVGLHSKVVSWSNRRVHLENDRGASYSGVAMRGIPSGGHP